MPMWCWILKFKVKRTDNWLPIQECSMAHSDNWMICTSLFRKMHIVECSVFPNGVLHPSFIVITG